MKFCIPKVSGRGAGLGNELLPWAKAFIASQELGGRLLQPAWGLNERAYYRYFGTSRVDWVFHRALGKVLPAYTVTEADFRATGETDYGAAIRRFGEEKGLLRKKAWVLYAEGMWGGYHAIRSARPFVLGALHRARGVESNLYNLARQEKPGRLTVAVHIRLGDFAPADPALDYRGRFNASIPLDWYMKTCRNLRDALGGHISFRLFSDGSPQTLKPFLDEFSPLTTWHQKDTVCSDFLAMANADLLVCSMSSFSFWAAFLSEKPYVVFEPSLQLHGELRSLWGHEIAQQGESGITAQSALFVAGHPGDLRFRGVPIGWDGAVPGDLAEHLRIEAALKFPQTDLVEYGVADVGTRCTTRIGGLDTK